MYVHGGRFPAAPLTSASPLSAAERSTKAVVDIFYNMRNSVLATTKMSRGALKTRQTRSPICLWIIQRRARNESARVHA
jgi:hypothetical protein